MDNTTENMVDNNAVEEKIEDTTGLFKAFCWPGFFMPHFWGLGNGLPLGLAALLVPIMAPIAAFVFGFDGYRMAYEKNPMDKKEFYNKQEKWRKGTIIYVGVLSAIFLLFGIGGITNYISNKMEITRILNEYEVNKERVLNEIDILLEEKYLDMYIEDTEYIPCGELEYSDDLEVWHLNNSYNYMDLSKGILVFEEPIIRSMMMKYTIEGNRNVNVYIHIDEHFEIEDVSCYIYHHDEVRMTEKGSVLLIDGDRERVCMDKAVIKEILKK